MAPRQHVLPTLLAFLLAVGCRQVTPASDAPGTAGRPDATPPRPAPSARELADATYTGLPVAPTVTLANGRWEGPSAVPGGAERPRVELLGGGHVTGDLVGDGAEEAVALLAASAGGSGTMQSLVVVGRDGDRLVQIAAAPLGDRIQVKTVRVEARRLIAEVVRHAAGDPRCCPTQRARLTWVVDGGKLTPMADDPTGALSLADLEGPEWVLTHWGVEEPLAGDVVPTLTVTGNRLAGHAGCNRYTAAVEAGTPGRFTVTRIVSTRMACPPPGDAVERRFLELLPKLHGLQFLAGDLLLTHDDGVLRFRARTARRD
jgi:heat shock protein HslJ